MHGDIIKNLPYFPPDISSGSEKTQIKFKNQMTIIKFPHWSKYSALNI